MNVQKATFQINLCEPEVFSRDQMDCRMQEQFKKVDISKGGVTQKFDHIHIFD